MILPCSVFLKIGGLGIHPSFNYTRLIQSFLTEKKIEETMFSKMHVRIKSHNQNVQKNKKSTNKLVCTILG